MKKGKTYKQKIQVAEETPFDNSSNDFDNNNSQSALEEIDFRQLKKEPTGIVDRSESTMSFVDGTMTFSISPVSTSFSYYIRGHIYTKTTTQSVTITDTEGVWYIYFDGDTLTTTQTAWDFEDEKAFVAFVYWDATNNKAIIFGEERHGVVMPWATHKNKHLTDGAKVEYGTFLADDYILGGDGSLDSHATLSIGNGTLHDEDLIMDITNSATPTNPFEQKLSTIANIPMYYKDGSSGAWRKIDATSFPLASQTGNTCRFNKEVGGSWSLVNATDNYIIASWVFATNNIFEPIIGIVGQKESPDLSTASSEDFYTNLDLTGLPFLENKLLYRLFYRTKTSFTNTPKAVLESLDGLLIPNIVPSPVVNYHIIDSTTFSTSSSTDAIITDFSVTPQAGSYAVWYSSAIEISTNNALAYCTIYKDGVAVSDSIRYATASGSNFNTMLSTQSIVRFDGTQACDIRVRQSSGTNYVYDRSLILIRLGA